MNKPDQDDAHLAAQIAVAIKEYDGANEVRKEKAIAAGNLLDEAHKRHPGDKAFAKFLEQENIGIGIRRAQELIAIAVGRRDFEQQQAKNREAVKKSRDKAEIEKQRAKLALPKPTPTNYSNASPEPEPEPKKSAWDKRPKAAKPKAEPKAEPTGSRAFNDFVYACKTYLPQTSEAEVTTAQTFVASYVFKRKAA